MELNCTENNGVLFIEAGDREFSVQAHQGRDAVRARRQVKKLFMPQVAEIANIKNSAYKKLSSSERERYDEITEQLDALKGSESESKKALLKEAEKILSKHEDSESITKLTANMSALLDLDQEQLLDDLVFKNTKARVSGGKWERLNSPETFDLIFAGKNSFLVEPVRDKIIDFNGFLDL